MSDRDKAMAEFWRQCGGTAWDLECAWKDILQWVEFFEDEEKEDEDIC